MVLPSILIEQHIGNMNMWIHCMKSRPEAKALEEMGCRFDSDFTVIDPVTEIRCTPDGLRGKLIGIEPKALDRIEEVFLKYLIMLRMLDQDMVRQAALLPEREKQLEFSLVLEQVKPGGRLWWKQGSHVWHIEFLKVDKNNAVIKYLNGNMCKEEEVQLQKMKLYLDGCDAKFKEGYDVTRI